MEIKQGDTVRVSKDAPKMYLRGFDHIFTGVESVVSEVEDDNAVIIFNTGHINSQTTIPTKYLVKVDADAKPKFRVGDWVKIKRVTAASLHELPDVYKNCPFKITAINGSMITAEGHEHSIYLPFHAFEPTEQIEANIKTDEIDFSGADTPESIERHIRRAAELTKTKGDTLTFPIAFDLSDSYWDAYAAELAKEVALKVANKFNDPKEAAEYAVSVAKAVVEGLKRE